jgi:hypothetical protein
LLERLAVNSGIDALVLVCLAMGVQTMVVAAVMVAAANFAASRIAGRPGLAQLGRNMHRWPQLVGLQILLSLIMATVGVVVMMLVGFAAYLMVRIGMTPLISVLAFLAIALACYAAVMAFLPAPWLLVHHGTGVLESLRLAGRSMQGKKLRALGITMVVSLLAPALCVLTLGLALLVLPALGALVWGVICVLSIPAWVRPPATQAAGQVAEPSDKADWA